MIVVMQHGSTEPQIDLVAKRIQALGFQCKRITGEERSILGLVGVPAAGKEKVREELEDLPHVADVLIISKPYKMAGREFQAKDTVITVLGVKIGGPKAVLMAGPCSVESKQQMIDTALACQAAGATILRGGAFKPRSSPYAFQGLGKEGLEYLAAAREATGLPIITEVMDTEDVKLIADYSDILQIGTRNMANFSLLRKVGKAGKPVMLKRGMAATIEEWLMAAEYIMAEGNPGVILCERGIRTFETATRFTLDLNAIPVIKRLSHLPIIADPSHGTGHSGYVAPMAKAAIAAGADGLMIEVHIEPEKALSDGPQALTPKNLGQLTAEIRKIAEAIGRSF